MDWFRRRCRDLTKVVGPTSVRVRGRLLDGPRVRSPFTDVDALVFSWTYSPSFSPPTRYCHSDHLRIGVGAHTILLPPNGFQIDFINPIRDEFPVDRDWPAMIPPPPGGERGIYIGEQLLCANDAIELTATVEPTLVDGGAYRGGPKLADFIARLDLEPIKLKELES